MGGKGVEPLWARSPTAFEAVASASSATRPLSDEAILFSLILKESISGFNQNADEECLHGILSKFFTLS